MRTHIRRRRGDEELTPLINVVFLLLIFVVLAGEVVETAPFAVTPPDARDVGAAPVEMTSIYLGPNGQIFLAGTEYSPGDLAVALASLPSEVPHEIVVEADRNVDAGAAIALVEALQKAGVRQIRLVASANNG